MNFTLLIINSLFAYGCFMSFVHILAMFIAMRMGELDFSEYQIITKYKMMKYILVFISTLVISNVMYIALYSGLYDSGLTKPFIFII